MMNLLNQKNNFNESLEREVFLENWCPRHDSNVKLLLRTELFYPLNYGGQQ